MKNYWSIDWLLQCDGLQHTWRELTPTARLRIRRLVGKGKSSGRLSATDFR